MLPAVLTDEIRDLSAVVDRVVARDVTGLADLALIGCAEELITQLHRLDHALGRTLNAIWAKESLVTEFGQSLKAWLVDSQHLSPAEATRRIHTAREENRSTRLSEAHAIGAISSEHVRQIGIALRKLPTDLHDLAEGQLLDAGKQTDPSSLGRALRDLEDRLGLNEDADARRERLYGDRYLKLAPTIDGMVKLDGMLDPLAASALKEAIAPLRGKKGAEDDRTQAQRDHDALADLINLALKTDQLPEHGGMPPQVIVSVSLGELTDSLDRLHIPTAGIDGQPLPPSTIRLLACDAGIIPAVMRGQSEVLDLGRSSRTWTKAQRLAARLRDGDTCTWPGGCNTPIRHCQLHHLEFWTEHHGGTDHRNGAHVCSFHHWLVHNRNWKLWRDNTGALQCRRT